MPLYLRTYGYNQLVKVRNDEPSYQIKTDKQITSSTHNKDNSRFLRANFQSTPLYASVGGSHASIVSPSKLLFFPFKMRNPRLCNIFLDMILLNVFAYLVIRKQIDFCGVAESAFVHSTYMWKVVYHSPNQF